MEKKSNRRLERHPSDEWIQILQESYKISIETKKQIRVQMFYKTSLKQIFVY